MLLEELECYAQHYLASTVSRENDVASLTWRMGPVGGWLTKKAANSSNQKKYILRFGRGCDFY